MKQSIKQFLIPDWRKILITVIITGLSLFFVHAPWYSEYMQPDEFGRITIINPDYFTVSRGLPLPYLITSANRLTEVFSIFYLGLIINLIFWYFVSCLIIFLYNKLKNKKAQLQKD